MKNYRVCRETKQAERLLGKLEGIADVRVERAMKLWWKRYAKPGRRF